MTPQEFEPLLHDAEVRMSRLRALYEQWFQGIERTEPTVPRKDLDRLLDLLKKNMPRNTALRFRYQMLIARYQSYITYWQRISRQIEDGTFKRDVQRAKRRGLARPSVAPPKDIELELDVEVELQAEEPPTGPSAPAVPKPPVFDDSDLDAILGALGARTEAPPAPRKPISPFASQAPPAMSANRGSIPPGPTATRAGVATFGRPKDAPTSSAEMRAVAITPLPPASPPASPPAPAAKPAIPPRAAPPAPPSPQRPVAVRPLAPPAAPVRTAPPIDAQPASGARPMPSAGAMEEARMRAIYDRYVEARRRNNERVDNLKYETLAASVEKMLPKLRAKHGDRSIDFDVVVQDGKVGLKPRVG